jgi:hypothetical protein
MTAYDEREKFKEYLEMYNSWYEDDGLAYELASARVEKDLMKLEAEAEEEEKRKRLPRHWFLWQRNWLDTAGLIEQSA